eukprot:jgi/Galph1/2568/GphlegSOOS_G1263.1
MSELLSQLMCKYMYDSVVVDREKDVLSVTERLYNLQLLRESFAMHQSVGIDRPVICFAPHLFGSGKTAFCKNYLNLVRQMGEVYLAESSRNLSKRTFVENLKSATLLHVDLNGLKPTVPEHEKRNLEWAVYYLLILRACEQMGISRPDPEEAYRRVSVYPDTLVSQLRDILKIPSSQYLLIAFDEVGTLEELAASFQLRTVGGVVRPYNDFFAIIRELCKQANIFFIVVGKSEGLSIQRYTSSVSKVELQFISLSPLEQYSIQEHLERSPTLPPNRRYVSEVLCNENFSTAQLAELLLEYTGGVPGLMTRAISLLLEYVERKRDSCISRQECLDLLKDRHVQQLCVLPYLSRFENFNEERRAILDMLILMALYRIPFDIDDCLELKTSTTDESVKLVPIFDLVTDMSLYRKEYIRKVYRQSRSSAYELLLGTLRMQPVEYFYNSKCRIFEGLVATRFWLMLSSGRKEDFLRNILSQLSTIWGQMNLSFSSDFTFYYIKSIHYTEALPGTERRTFGSNQWKHIVDKVIEFEKIYIPESETSHGPDILFQLHAKNGNGRLVVGIACKGRWSSHGIGWSDIKNEAEKFLSPLHHQALSENDSLYGMLIIISTKLAPSLSNVLNDTSCIYSAGSIVDASFQVPNNCELVILCKEDLERIFGEPVLDRLANAFTLSDNPDLRDIGISTMKQIVKSLR